MDTSDLPFRSGFYKVMLDQMSEGVYFTDTDRRILYWNAAAEHLTGFSSQDVIGSYCQDNILRHVDCDGCEMCDNACPLFDAIEQGRQVYKRAFLYHKKGFRLPVDVRISPVYGPAKRVIGAVEVFSDASGAIELENLNQTLKKQLRIDLLTKLPNRRAFLGDMKNELTRFKRYGTPFAVIAVDIDHFKQVNDTFGHPTGDRVLVWFASQLRSVFRRVDTVSRYGGEEFFVLLPNSSCATAMVAATKMKDLLNDQPCPATGEYLTASFGATSLTAKDTVKKMLERADRALYQAKDNGRNCIVVL